MLQRGIFNYFCSVLIFCNNQRQSWLLQLWKKKHNIRYTLYLAIRKEDTLKFESIHTISGFLECGFLRVWQYGTELPLYLLPFFPYIVSSMNYIKLIF